MPLSGAYYYPVMNLGGTASFPSYITNAINQFLASGSSSGSSGGGSAFTGSIFYVSGVQTTRNVSAYTSGIPVTVGLVTASDNPPNQAAGIGFVSGNGVLYTDGISNYFTTPSPAGTLYMFGGGYKPGAGQNCMYLGPSGSANGPTFYVRNLTSSIVGPAYHYSPVNVSSSVNVSGNITVSGTIALSGNVVVSGGLYFQSTGSAIHMFSGTLINELGSGSIQFVDAAGVVNNSIVIGATNSNGVMFKSVGGQTLGVYRGDGGALGSMSLYSYAGSYFRSNGGGTAANPTITLNTVGTLGGVYFPSGPTIALATSGSCSLYLDPAQNAGFSANVNVSGNVFATQYLGKGVASNYGVTFGSSSVAITSNGVQALTFDSLGNATFNGNVSFSGAVGSGSVASTVPAVINTPSVYFSDDFIATTQFMTNSSTGQYIVQYGFPTPAAVVTPNYLNAVPVSQVPLLANHPGFMMVAASGAASVANAYAYSNQGTFQILSGTSATYVWRYLFYTPASASNATNRYQMRVGPYSGLAHDGFFAYYSDNNNSGNWTLFEAVGAVEGAPVISNSTVPFVPNTWNTLTIAYTGSTNQLSGWMNGTFMGSGSSPWLSGTGRGILLPAWGISVQCVASDNTCIYSFLDRVDVSITGLTR